MNQRPLNKFVESESIDLIFCKFNCSLVAIHFAIVLHDTRSESSRTRFKTDQFLIITLARLLARRPAHPGHSEKPRDNLCKMHSGSEQEEGTISYTGQEFSLYTTDNVQKVLANDFVIYPLIPTDSSWLNKIYRDPDRIAARTRLCSARERS